MNCFITIFAYDLAAFCSEMAIFLPKQFNFVCHTEDQCVQYQTISVCVGGILTLNKEGNSKQAVFKKNAFKPGSLYLKTS